MPGGEGLISETQSGEDAKELVESEQNPGGYMHITLDIL